MSFFSKFFGVNKNSDSKKDSELLVEKFETIHSFWEFVTKEDKWYLKYSPYRIKNIDKYISDLAPLIIKTTNQLRTEMKFTSDEYWEINKWDNFLFQKDNSENGNFKLDKDLKFKQNCSNCKKDIGYAPRYPKSICRNCYDKKTDIEGRKVEFYNTYWSGAGCQGYYVGTEQKEKYDSNDCFIDGKEFFAEEARFGGIVIQLKE